MYIPELDFFTQDNAFTGSVLDKIRYRVAIKDDKLTCQIWFEDISFEKASKIDVSKDFEVSHAALEELNLWLSGELEKYHKFI